MKVLGEGESVHLDDIAVGYPFWFRGKHYIRVNTVSRLVDLSTVSRGSILAVQIETGEITRFDDGSTEVIRLGDTCSFK